jgi:hypothetical protein
MSTLIRAKNENKKLIEENLNYKKAMEKIATVAKRHDTGQRQYKMTDWEYVLKQCEKVLK